MKSIRVYDSPQCCSTGACSPEEDDAMAQFASSLEWLKGKGFEVERFNLAHQPGAFVENATVKTTLDTDGMDCLPMVMVDDAILVKGDYLTRAQLGDALGIEIEAPVAASSGCCGPSADEAEKAPAVEAAGCCGPTTDVAVEEKKEAPASAGCCG